MALDLAVQRRSPTSSAHARDRRSVSSMSPPTLNVSPVHRFQRAIGNAATAKLFRSTFLQPKLSVARADDEYEREADRVADQVMRMADGHSPTKLRIGNVSMVQRKCACGGGSDEPCSCDQMQRKAVS